MAGNCTENMAPYFKQRICDDWLLFSSDKYLIFKSSLVGRNLHFPSLQNAFRHPHTQPRPVRPARKSEPFLLVAETPLLLAECPRGAQCLPVPRQADWAERLVLTIGQGAEGTGRDPAEAVKATLEDASSTSTRRN